ncbi:hypothetical protein ACWCPK_38435 [Streptomyces sp. NPDC001953]
MAETAQRVLLRPLPRHLEDIDVEVLYQAAAAQARIGGDFYEAMQTPHGVRLIIGDVRGKGLPAVEVASAILSTFRVLRMSAPDLHRTCGWALPGSPAGRRGLDPPGAPGIPVGAR